MQKENKYIGRFPVGNCLAQKNNIRSGGEINIMPVARNMKELEKMILDRVKKELPKVTKEYCHKWYDTHPEMVDIVSEESFIKMVNDSFKFSMKNGQLDTEFGIFQKDDISEEHSEKMIELWEDFKGGYKNYVMSKILK